MILPAYKHFFVSFLCGVIFFAATPFIARAAILDDLKQSIDQKQQEIKKLEEEAKQYREQIAQKQTTGRTLKGELAQIEKTVSQIKKDITLTQRKIQKTQLEMKELDIEISAKEASIAGLRKGLAGLIGVSANIDSESIVAVLLQHPALSDFLNQLNYVSQINDKIFSSLKDLRALKEELGVKHADAAGKKAEAENLKQVLNARQGTLAEEKQARNTLLVLTKNEEARYQELLHDREGKIAALEQEVRDIEKQINVTIDVSSLPNKGTGVLGWPLANLSLAVCTGSRDALINCITQFFGYTAFARAGAYGGKQGHNGMDFRASVGTEVLAADAGSVVATGDTDLGCRGASYGRWILLRHPDNLATLYGHLSQIGVNAGQAVTRGQFIGLSGATGYATGPHLHFGVFVAQAVEVRTIRSVVCGRNMVIPAVGNDPVSGVNGYLNPLDYL